METITGNPRPERTRDGHAFDALIAQNTTTVAEAKQPRIPNPVDDPMLDDPAVPRTSFRAVTLVILVALAALVIAVIALITAPQQSADTAAVDAAAVDAMPLSGPITAADVAAQVERGWVDTGASGSVTCPEPVEQTPGTTMDCAAVYDSTPLVFTAVIGDVDAGEPRILIASWSEVAPG